MSGWYSYSIVTSSNDVRVADLRKLAWSGTPSDLRPVVWPVLLVRATAS